MMHSYYQEELKPALDEYVQSVSPSYDMDYVYYSGILKAVVEMLPNTKENREHLQGFVNRWKEMAKEIKQQKENNNEMV
jgi:hypothetical protein